MKLGQTLRPEAEELVMLFSGNWSKERKRRERVLEREWEDGGGVEERGRGGGHG